MKTEDEIKKRIEMLKGLMRECRNLTSEQLEAFETSIKRRPLFK